MKTSIVAVPFLATLSLMMIVGCSKSASEQPSNKTSDARKNNSSAASSPRAQIQAMTANQARVVLTPAQEVAALEKEYRAATDPNAKNDAVYGLGTLGTREAAEALGRIFQSETDADVKEDILNALSVVDGQEKTKLTTLKLGASRDQPDNVRKAAIDGLGDLEDPGAIEVLKTLLADPNEEIRQAAKDAIELSQSSSTMQQPQ